MVAQDLRDRVAAADLTKEHLIRMLRDAGTKAEDEREYERWRYFSSRADAMYMCRSVRVFHHRTCGGPVRSALSCDVRGCPDCDRTRSRRLVDAYQASVARVVAERQPGYRAAFWTWTLADLELRPHLAESIAFLRGAFGKLRDRAIMAGGRCGTLEPDGSPYHACHPPLRSCPTRCPNARRRSCPEHPSTPHPHVAAGVCPADCPHVDHWCQAQYCHRTTAWRETGVCPHRGVHDHRRPHNCPAFVHQPVLGGVVALEIAASRAGRWHPHLHGILEAPWIDWREMSMAWRALTCTVPACRHGDDDDRCTGAWSVFVRRADADAIHEVLKYTVKPQGILDQDDPERYAEFLWATRHQRLVNGFGSFRGVHDRADDEPDTDTIVLHGFGFTSWRVPRVCPHCGAETTEDEWTYPVELTQLEALSFPSVYGRRRPAAYGGAA